MYRRELGIGAGLPAGSAFQHMRSTTLTALLVFCSLGAAAKAPEPVASRITAQNALFEEQYQSDLKRHPERATAIGDYRTISSMITRRLRFSSSMPSTRTF